MIYGYDLPSKEYLPHANKTITNVSNEIELRDISSKTEFERYSSDNMQYEFPPCQKHQTHISTCGLTNLLDKACDGHVQFFHL